MNEVLRLARALTLHIAAMDAKFGIIYTNTFVHGINGTHDAKKLMEKANELDAELRNYLGVKGDVSKS